MESVKEKNGLHVSKEMHLNAEIRKDKLDNPKKYVKRLKKQNANMVLDRDIYYSIYETNDPKKLSKSRGNLYLS